MELDTEDGAQHRQIEIPPTLSQAAKDLLAWPDLLVAVTTDVMSAGRQPLEQTRARMYSLTTLLSEAHIMIGP